MTPAQLNALLNKKSGLLGISGFSSDLRDLIAAMDQGASPTARLAFEQYVHRLARYIGGYAVALQGLDVLLFTDDIGLTNWRVREAVCRRLAWCGVRLDEEKNRQARTDGISEIGEPGCVRVLVVPTDEELVIGREGVRLIEVTHVAH